MTQAGIYYQFKAEEGLRPFRFERAINVSRGKETSWSRSTVTVWCKSEEDFHALLDHWDNQSNGVRSYKALK